MESRIAWVRSAPFASTSARRRALWHYVIRRYAYEICLDCGRPVGPHTGSWWSAPDLLWNTVVGAEEGVLCPPCFTGRAQARGFVIKWEAVIDG